MVITVPDTSIRIEANNAEDAYIMAFRLQGWVDLEIDGEFFPSPCGHNTTQRAYWLTRDWFKAKFEGRL